MDPSAITNRELTTVVRRLEAVVSRLEDLAEVQGGPTAPTNHVPPAPAPPTAAQPAVSLQPSKPPVPKQVVAFDDLILNAKFPPFMKLSEELGDGVWEAAQNFRALFNDLRSLILLASACKKPSVTDINNILTPINKAMVAMNKMKDDHRSKPFANHVAGVVEGVGALGWVIIEPKPGPYIGEIKDSTQFFTNRVLKEYKDKDPKHVEWVKSFSAILEELRKYVMEYHTTGLVWNPKGVDYTEYTPSSDTSATPAPPPSPPGAPPPPPPPPADLSATSVAKAAPVVADPSAIFAQLNVGEGVTKGLKKVSDDQKTHKNPSLRAGGTVPPAAVRSNSNSSLSTGRPTKPTKPKILSGKKPPKLELEGKKWIVEHQENESSLIIEDGEISQSVNLFGCKNSVVQIKGKVNAITMLNCEKTSILLDSVVSSVSITGSKSFQLQVLGTVPTILLDAVDSGQVYLSKDCLGVEIVSAKCSAINVSVPEEGAEEGVFVEHAVPEQLRTVVTGGKLVTTVVEHVG